MKEITLHHPDDKDIVIKVKSITLADNNLLTVDYETINTNPKGIIDDEAIGKYMDQWLLDLVDRAIQSAEEINLNVHA